MSYRPTIIWEYDDIHKDKLEDIIKEVEKKYSNLCDSREYFENFFELKWKKLCICESERTWTNWYVNIIQDVLDKLWVDYVCWEL